MGIVRCRQYSPDIFEALCRSSEFQPAAFRQHAPGADKRKGHTHSRHIAITRAEMAARGDDFVETWEHRRKGKNKPIGAPLVAITSFITNDDAFRAGAALLNAATAQKALLAMDGGHTGMRATITDFETVPVRVRYLTGGNAVAAMPCHWFRMLIDRTESAPYGLHLHTFFPLIDPESNVGAKIQTKDGADYKAPAI